jgi:hypothetical protein
VIFDHYGPTTNVQVMGGDLRPRRRAELIVIVRRIFPQEHATAMMTRAKRSPSLLKPDWATRYLASIIIRLT